MEHMNTCSLNEISFLFLDKIYKKTTFAEQDSAEADCVFNAVKKYLPLISEKDKQGLEIVRKFSMFATSICNQDSFKDMVKIAWRTIKTKTGQPQYKLSLLIIALAALVQNINPVYNEFIDDWICFITQWLGTQLTIGGKGVIGKPEGSVIERIKQFFATPYLHDFD